MINQNQIFFFKNKNTKLSSSSCSHDLLFFWGEKNFFVSCILVIHFFFNYFFFHLMENINSVIDMNMNEMLDQKQMSGGGNSSSSNSSSNILLYENIKMQKSLFDSLQEMTKEMKRFNDLSESFVNQVQNKGIKPQVMHQVDFRVLRMVLIFFLKVAMNTRRSQLCFRGWFLVKIDSNQPSSNMENTAIVIHQSLIKMVYMLQHCFVGESMHVQKFFKNFRDAFHQELLPLYQLCTPENTQMWQMMFPWDMKQHVFFVCRASRWITYLKDEYTKLINHESLLKPDANLSLPYFCHDQHPLKITVEQKIMAQNKEKSTAKQLTACLIPYGLLNLEKMHQMMPDVLMKRDYISIDDCQEYLEQECVQAFYHTVSEACEFKHENKNENEAKLKHWNDMKWEDPQFYPVHSWSTLIHARFGLPSPKILDWLMEDFPQRLNPPLQWTLQECFSNYRHQTHSFMCRLDHLQYDETKESLYQQNQKSSKKRKHEQVDTNQKKKNKRQKKHHVSLLYQEEEEEEEEEETSST